MSTRGDPTRPALLVLAGGLAKRYGGCKPLAPIGLHGEAVIDLTASDAVSAGFGEIVVVLGPQTSSAITYHVRRCWPSSVPVSFVVQQVPLGTAHAVLCARKVLPDGPFAVVNADDVYGVPALQQLARHFSQSRQTDQAGAGAEHATEHALVSFALRDTIVTHEPVTRGTCAVGSDGKLLAIVERRKVTMHDDGHFRSEDGLEPVEIPGSLPVSVNLWGFEPEIWPVLESAVLLTHPGVAPDGTTGDVGVLKSDEEVLLPEVVAEMVAGRSLGGERNQSVRVLEGSGRCLGVTHADDTTVVRRELATMIGQGLRPEGLWEGLR